MMRGIVLFFLLAGTLSVYADKQKLHVLSTIKPIHSIVFAIAGENAETSLLIPAYSSPHDYTFKPSDIRKIKKSDIIFRIDEHFEAMLTPAFENLSEKTQLVSLAEIADMHLLPLLKGHEDEHNHSHSEGEGEEHQNVDLHIWTSPENSIVMAKAIASFLSEADPENSQSYQINLGYFMDSVMDTTQDIRSDFSSIKDKPYIVFHNSWQYFGHFFDLQNPSIIALHEGVSSGAKTLKGVRDKIESDDIGCVFSDPSVSSARVKALIGKLAVKNIEIDVLARELSLDKDTYSNWLKMMGQQVKSCLE